MQARHSIEKMEPDEDVGLHLHPLELHAGLMQYEIADEHGWTRIKNLFHNETVI